MTGRWTEWRLPPGLLLRKCEGERQRGGGKGGKRREMDEEGRKGERERERKEGEEREVEKYM